MNSNSVDVNSYVDVLLNEGVADNIGHELISNGFLGKESFTHTAVGYGYTFNKNNQFYWLERTDTFQSSDPYYQGIHEMYVDIVKQMKKSDSMETLLYRADKDVGLKDDEYSRAAVEKIAATIMKEKVDEIKRAHQKGCKGKKSGEFEYDGKTYECTDIYVENIDYDKVYGYDQFGIFAENIIESVDNHLDVLGGNVTGTMVEEVEKSNNKVQNIKNGTSGNNSNSSSGSNGSNNTNTSNNGNDNTNGTSTGTQPNNPGNSSDDTPSDGEDKEEEKQEVSINYDIGQTNYKPSLLNAIKFSNEMAKKGELESLTGKVENEKDSNLLSAFKDVIKEFSEFGRYILYGALIIYGVKMIWSGVEGKTQFKQHLPFILLAIIFFYMAPQILDLFVDIFSVEQIENILPNTWASVVELVQIFAFAGIVFNGVKLMFADPNGRVDVKSRLIPIIVGCVLVFAASTVVSFVVKTAEAASLEKKDNLYYEDVIKKDNKGGGE